MEGEMIGGMEGRKDGATDGCNFSYIMLFCFYYVTHVVPAAMQRRDKAESDQWTIVG